MNKELLKEAVIKWTSGVILMTLLLFVPAGTWKWPDAWWLMALLFIPMFIAGVVMAMYAPNLLLKRLKAKEQQTRQKDVIRYSGLMFIVSFIVAGLSNRFGWLQFPHSIVVIGRIVFLVGYGLFALVLKENEYLSRTIEVQENQTVIDTGLYGIVRHPMYSATLLIFLSMPVMLGSVLSFLVMLMYIPIIRIRIEDEEQVLEKDLDGYKEYKQKVKYRLIPFIW